VIKKVDGNMIMIRLGGKHCRRFTRPCRDGYNDDTNEYRRELVSDF